jgi:hypothetical protein
VLSPFARHRSRRLRSRRKFEAKLAAAIAIAAGFGLLALPARADAEDDARRLFVEGRALRSSDRCADAIPLFRKAYEVYRQGLGSLRNIAECEERLGHLAAARRSWSELEHALQMTTDADAKYAGWIHDAEDSEARLATKVGRLVVSPEADTPATAGVPRQVTVNGAVWKPSTWRTPVDVDPGHYVVVLDGGANGKPEVTAVDVAAGETRRVELGERHATAAAPVLSTAPGATSQGKDGREALRTGAWVAAGIGVAGLIGMAISAGVEQSAAATVNQECPTGSCSTAQQPALQGTIDRGRTAATLVNVFIGVGAAGVATGALLFVLGAPRREQAAVFVTPGGLAVAGRF